MENAKIRPPVESTPLDRLTKSLSQVIMSGTRPPMPNIMQIRPRGASRQTGKILVIHVKFSDIPVFVIISVPVCIKYSINHLSFSSYIVFLLI